MATIGELIINLKADTASFASDLKRAANLSFDTSRQMERSFKIIGTAVVGAIGTAAVAATAMAARAIDTADKMGKLAQSTGLSVEQFSALSYAAKLSDVDTGTLSQSLVNLAKNLEKANQATQEGRAAHSALGTLFRGNIPVFNTTQEAFETIAERLAALPDGYQKSALAAQIFGRSGAALIPLLNQGAAGIEKASEEAAKFGVVVSTQTAKRAEELNDQMQRLRAAVEGFGLRLAETLLPYLTRAADALVNFTRNAADMQTTANALKTSVQVVATAFTVLYGAARFAGDAVANLLFALNALAKAPRPGGFFNKESWEEWNRSLVELRASLKQTVDDQGQVANILRGIWQEPAQAAQTFSQTVDSVMAAAQKRLQAVADTSASAAEAIHKVVAGLQEQIATFGMSAEQLAAHNAALEGAGVAEQRYAAHLAHRLELMKQASSDAAMPRGRGGFTGVIPEGTAPEFPFIAPEIDLKALGIELDNLPPKFEAVNQAAAKLGPIAIQVRQDISEMFTQAIFRADGFRDAMGRLLERIAEVIFQTQVMDRVLGSAGGGGGILGGIIKGITGIFTGGIGGGSIGDAVPVSATGVQFAAAGGFASPGEPFIVGERGPELFIPQTAGAIVPRERMGGMSISITNNIDARGAAPGAEMALRAALKESENRTIARTMAALKENERRRP